MPYTGVGKAVAQIYGLVGFLNYAKFAVTDNISISTLKQLYIPDGI